MEGISGKVYSFEFIPGNIDFFRQNVALNLHTKDIITPVEQPVSDKSGQELNYYDNGPGSKLELQPFEGMHGSVVTISIDDFVDDNRIEKVDFIKMDIEGAEMLALKGAQQIIEKHRPVLAISIYHSMEDFSQIPNWIHNIGLGYQRYLDIIPYIRKKPFYLQWLVPISDIP